MSTLPADAGIVEIEEEMVYQQTLLDSLDPTEADYEDRAREMHTELGLLEERLTKANDSGVDTSDLSFESASTSLTTPSEISSTSNAHLKRPLPADLDHGYRGAKRPSPTPSTFTSQARVRQRQAEVEATYKLQQLQRERDAQYARELSTAPEAVSSTSALSSRPAWQATLQSNSVLNPTVRSALQSNSVLDPTVRSALQSNSSLNPAAHSSLQDYSNRSTLPTNTGPNPAVRSTLYGNSSLNPTVHSSSSTRAAGYPDFRIKRDPEHSTGQSNSSASDVIDLTSDEPVTRSLLGTTSPLLYPPLPNQQPGPRSIPWSTQQASGPPRATQTTPLSHSYMVSQRPGMPQAQYSPYTSLAGPSTGFPAGASQHRLPSSHTVPSPSDRLAELQNLIDLTRPSWSQWPGSDEDDNDGDGWVQNRYLMPGSFDTYAGREDLYRRRFEQIESYNPEKTREEINSLLNNIRPDEELPDHLLIQTPEAMSIKLHKYQELGLTWLKKCEEGSNKGGILADDMGLGKTIQMLSLIVSRKSTNPRCKTTLIVAPVALLRQWKQEIEQKIKRRFGLTVHIHHQTGKKAHFRDLAVFDIVLTTFGSLAIEARRMEKYLLRKKDDAQATPRADERCTLIGEDAHWYRVILDEAQCIKNKQTQTARAACYVKAEYRFCMTGTPMMNNVDELYSLVKFLRIKPYDRWEKFREDISQPLKNHMDGVRDPAMQRLQALCKAVMLRRTKKSEYRGKPILVLPERTTDVDHATFDDDESSLYNALEQKTQVTFNKYLEAGTVGRQYSAILVLLLRLRQACCHPFLIKDLSIAAAADMTSDELVELAKDLSAQAVTRIKETNGNFECPICMDAVINPAIFLPCGHDTCRECYVKLADTSTGIAQGHENGVKARCPHCRGDIDPKKITDFTSFKRVWMPELLTKEEKEQFNLVEEVDQDLVATQEELDASTESESETESEDEDSDLGGFVVDDDESEREQALEKGDKGKETAQKSKKRKSKKKGKKKAVLVEKPAKLLTFANLKANARGKKKTALLDKLREGYKDSAKIRQLLALLDQITADDSTEKILVFSQWTSLLDLVEIAMQPRGWDYRRYDGSMNATERADAVDDFKDGDKDVRIMLVSLKAGNAGLNLNVASQVIILDPFWNPYIEEQAIDRAHRIGQNRPVRVHRVLIENTVEDRILELQEKKRKIIETALDEQQASQLSRLGARELAYLFGISRNLA